MNTSRRKARPAPAQTEAEHKDAEASEGDFEKMQAMLRRLMNNLADAHVRAAAELREAAR